MRFRGVSVLHCHGVLVWRRAVFSTGGSTTGKGWQNWQKTIFNIGTGGSTTGKGSQNWQKAIFNRISEGTLDTFLVRFRGVSVLHCHGVLVWRSIGKRLFLSIFNRVSEGTLESFRRNLVRFRGVSVLHCHGVLVWRRAVFSTGGNTTGKGWQNWQKTIFNIGKRLKDYFLFYWQKTIFNRVSEGTLDSFLLRFRGVSVLHCHGVLVWRRDVFSTGGSTTGKGWQNWTKRLFLIGFQKGR